jgi:2-amino-4-hydroxy-6-hydroxymethyldihydropteridine diphosphokinase
MNTAYLLIGGNLGDIINNFQKAIELLNQQGGKVIQKSSIYETAPWGYSRQQNFLNQAILLQTPLKPTDLMHLILKIEESLGRERKEKYGPRIIDIDILFFNDLIIQDPRLTIPHPEIQNRRFALIPLAEIAPELNHPALNKNIKQLLFECPDNLEVALVK